MTQVLGEIKKMSLAERILLVEAIWDSIAAESQSLGLSDAQKAHLRGRLDSYHENPEDVLSWEQIKSSLK
jgi:putative addiction module component (TIGR02574 family)